MPPTLALYLTLGFIAFLFWRDARGRPEGTSALWLPFFWVIVGSGSRFLSQWLDIFGIHTGGITVEDGSPIDAAFYLLLILAGIRVLHQRRINFATFFRNNHWVAIYFAYCLLSVLWSDFPYVASKRWIKLFGDPVMALVILTEPEPLESFALLMKRCAYVMLPVSILFIKYFPWLGRGFDDWTGVAHNTGIATNKNELGFDCWILGSALFWHLLQVWNRAPGKARRSELVLCVGLLGMDVWLLHEAQSATSLVALVLGAAIMLGVNFRWVNVKRIGVYICAGVIGCVLAGAAFGLFGDVIHLLGRNETFTGRTDIWRMLWNWKINPVIGTGFESFWLGERREEIQSQLSFLNEAHNGYLETYLNLGYVGVGLTMALLLATYAKARRSLLANFEWGRFRLAFLFAFIVYNWTEAAFRLNAFPFFMFFIIAIDYPARQFAAEEQITDLAEAGSGTEPGYISAGWPIAVNER
ncbi:MAG TPA: O-antigen ligase family protein [Verrucomicrobiae bacterium]|nr:O-antigen ligase family protein [Verrucomicrobiae bacterium]